VAGDSVYLYCYGVGNVKTGKTYDFKWRRKAAQAFAQKIVHCGGWARHGIRLAGIARESEIGEAPMKWLTSILASTAEDLISKAGARERKRMREGKVIRQGRR
jgi:hypothetical protein